ncbi:MAG: hypothetical protein NTU44_08415 [Bacteroidetes bacterium]|nr:hypothetical protein [Bacteroidota bacterium]
MNASSSDFPVFVKKLVYFTLILGIIAFLIKLFLPLPYRTPALPFLLLFFFAVTLIVHYILIRSVDKKLSRFVSLYLGSTFLKLMLYLIVFILYVFTHRADAIGFSLTFLVFYLAYTVFEVISLLGKTNQPPQN